MSTEDVALKVDTIMSDNDDDELNIKPTTKDIELQTSGSTTNNGVVLRTDDELPSSYVSCCVGGCSDCCEDICEHAICCNCCYASVITYLFDGEAANAINNNNPPALRSNNNLSATHGFTWLNCCGVGCEDCCEDVIEHAVCCNCCSDVQSGQLPGMNNLDENEQDKWLKARRCRRMCYGISVLVFILIIVISGTMVYFYYKAKNYDWHQ